MELLSHCNRLTKLKALDLFKCAKYSKSVRNRPPVYKKSIDFISAKRIRVVYYSLYIKKCQTDLSNSCGPLVKRIPQGRIPPKLKANRGDFC